MSKEMYVHYTVTQPHNPPNIPPQKGVAGPYSEEDVCEHRRDIANYAGIVDCYVSESPKVDE